MKHIRPPLKCLPFLLDAVLFQVRYWFIEHPCVLVHDGLEQSHEASDFPERITIQVLRVRAVRSFISSFGGVEREQKKKRRGREWRKKQGADVPFDIAQNHRCESRENTASEQIAPSTLVQTIPHHFSPFSG